jgi:hypothetical protein
MHSRPAYHELQNITTGWRPDDKLRGTLDYVLAE